MLQLKVWTISFLRSIRSRNLSLIEEKIDVQISYYTGTIQFQGNYFKRIVRNSRYDKKQKLVRKRNWVDFQSRMITIHKKTYAVKQGRYFNWKNVWIITCNWKLMNFAIHKSKLTKLIGDLEFKIIQMTKIYLTLPDKVKAQSTFPLANNIVTRFYKEMKYNIDKIPRKSIAF